MKQVKGKYIISYYFQILGKDWLTKGRFIIFFWVFVKKKRSIEIIFFGEGNSNSLTKLNIIIRTTFRKFAVCTNLGLNFFCIRNLLTSFSASRTSQCISDAVAKMQICWVLAQYHIFRVGNSHFCSKLIFLKSDRERFAPDAI